MSAWVSGMVDEGPGPYDQSSVGRVEAAKLLGVDVDAPTVEVQRAFRAAVKEAHPDSGATDGEAFGELHAARELLLGRSSGGSNSKESRSTKTEDEPVVEADPTPASVTAAASESAEPAVEPAPSTRSTIVGGDRSALFGRGVLLMAAGLGLLIGLLVAAAVVTGNETQSVRISPVADVPDDCIIVGAGTIEGASCDAPGALSVASQSTSSAACATGTTRLEIPNGDTFCLRPEVQD